MNRKNTGCRRRSCDKINPQEASPGFPPFHPCQCRRTSAFPCHKAPAGYRIRKPADTRVCPRLHKSPPRRVPKELLKSGTASPPAASRSRTETPSSESPPLPFACLFVIKMPPRAAKPFSLALPSFLATRRGLIPLSRRQPFLPRGFFAASIGTAVHERHLRGTALQPFLRSRGNLEHRVQRQGRCLAARHSLPAAFSHAPAAQRHFLILRKLREQTRVKTEKPSLRLPPPRCAILLPRLLCRPHAYFSGFQPCYRQTLRTPLFFPGNRDAARAFSPFPAGSAGPGAVRPK